MSAANTDKAAIDALTFAFFNLFTNKDRQTPDCDVIYDLCLPGTVIMESKQTGQKKYSLSEFVTPRKYAVQNGILTNFEEVELSEQTYINSNTAIRSSAFQKNGFIHGTFFDEYGTKVFNYIKTGGLWKITVVAWEHEFPY